MATYAIGDIHGCLRTLKALLFDVIKIQKGDQIIFLGDYIDRGPQSKQVLDFLLELIEDAEIQLICLKGNHEQIMLNSFDQGGANASWMMQGGAQCLDSFNCDHIKDVPKKYIDFMRAMPHFHIYKNFLCVHGGFDFEIDDIFSDSKAMLWARHYTVDPQKTENRIVVHGHTSIKETEILSTFEATNNFEINLDNGCVYYTIEGMGNLYALQMNGEYSKGLAKQDLNLFKAAYCE